MNREKIDDLITLVDRRMDAARARVSESHLEIRRSDLAIRNAQSEVNSLNEAQRLQMLAGPSINLGGASLESVPDASLSRIRFLKCAEARQVALKQEAEFAKQEAAERKKIALGEMTAASQRKDIYNDLRKAAIRKEEYQQQNREDEATSEIYLSRVAQHR
jgi:hypothetical protein